MMISELQHYMHINTNKDIILIKTPNIIQCSVNFVLKKITYSIVSH